MNAGAVILAAGGSRRMGRPKQLLKYDGASLVARAVEAATGAGCSPVVVVLGSSRQSIARELAGRDAVLVVNEEWEKGMGTSIRQGISAVQRERVDGAILMLCDQPRVGAESLRRLIDGARSSRLPISAAGYGGTTGTPSYFSRETFPELLALADDAGGKGVIRWDPSRVCVVPMDEAALDVDTPEDWFDLQGSQ